MLFSSSIFLFGFLPAVLLFYYIFFRRNRKWQNIFLTCVSLFFYAWGEPFFVLIMICSIIINWAFALWVDKVRADKTKAKYTLALMVAVNIGLLFVFKYLVFTIVNINRFLGADIIVPNIILPIGISFFTFQAMSYVIDVYRNAGKAQKNPLNVALYISFFPQLIAGPIVRYNTVAEQIINRKETFNDFSEGVCRFIIGLSKKILLANTLALVADKAFAAQSPSVALAWLGIFAYTFQIYFDFSGYSDMAIGLGKMFGFHFLENFNYPYISKSITEFWRRWHISLGTWFREYVYIPLGGSRVSTKYRLIFNLFVVWFLTGVWHGANWTFFVWGLLYFVLITWEKLTGFDKKTNWLGTIYAMFFVMIGWVIFRSSDLTAAVHYIGHLFGYNNKLIDADAILYLKNNIVYFIFAFLCSAPTFSYFEKKLSNSKVYHFIYPIIMGMLFVVSISFIVKGAHNPFIYFNF